MNSKLVLSLFLLTASCTPLSTKEMNNQLTYTALVAIDWKQTREIATNDAYYEQNPVLGGQPSVERVDRTIALTLAAEWAFIYMLPEDYREPFQYLFIGAEALAVGHNYRIGIRFDL